MTLAAAALGCAFSAQASAETFISAFKGVPSTTGANTSRVTTFDDTVRTTTQVVRAGVLVDLGPTFDLVAGDVINAVNSGTGAIIGSATFDGMPALDASTCIGSAAFNGTRSANATVNSVVAFRRERATSTYGAFDAERDVIRGSVITVGAGSFSGGFRAAIPAGHIVSASETALLSPTVTYDATVERVATTCPPPAPPAPPVKDTAAPTGKIFLPAFLKRSLLRSKAGIKLKADIDEAGSVQVDVYVDNGAKLPKLQAGAAATKKKAKLTKLATGKKKTKLAARLTVTIKSTALGRRLMKSKKRIKAIVVTTLRDSAGNAARLKTKKITIR